MYMSTTEHISYDDYVCTKHPPCIYIHQTSFYTVYTLYNVT